MPSRNSALWYCLKAKTKREPIAAQILRSGTDLEVFCPRTSIIKKTVRGHQLFTEGLFPGRLFCRFNLEESSRLVTFSQDIKGIVTFGERTRIIPDSVIESLKAAFPEETAEAQAPAFPVFSSGLRQPPAPGYQSQSQNERSSRAIYGIGSRTT